MWFPRLQNPPWTRLRLDPSCSMPSSFPAHPLPAQLHTLPGAPPSEILAAGECGQAPTPSASVGGVVGLTMASPQPQGRPSVPGPRAQPGGLRAEV